MTFADYVTAVLADSPLAFWPLQDAGDFPQDISGNGNHMDTKSVGTSLTYRTGLTQGPMSSYAIATNLAYVGRAASPLTATDNLAFEIWAKSVATSATEPFFGVAASTFFDNGNAPGSAGYVLESTNIGQFLIIGINSSATPTFKQFYSTAPGAGMRATGWSHVVAVRRAGVWELWINGVQVGSAETYTPGAPTGLGVWIGSRGSSGSPTASGQFAYAALYNAPLSGTRIAAHFAAMSSWPVGQIEQDNQPTAVAAGTFTTQGGNGLRPDVPPHYADYPELSWLGIGGGVESPAFGRVRLI